MKEKIQIRGVIEFARNGIVRLISKDKEFSDLIITSKNLGQAFDGDLVEVSATKSLIDGEVKITQAKVTRILERKTTDFLGAIDIVRGSSEYAFVKTSGKNMPVDFFVPINKIAGAKNGDVVIVRLKNWKERSKCPNGVVIKVIGKSNTHQTEMETIMFKNGIDYTFPIEVENEASLIPVEISENEILSRRDVRDILTFTIDDISAKDLDDALSFRELDNGNFEVGVHIADIGHYVKKGGEIDKEALKRGTSIYLVDRTIPMLPEKLSNNLASLNPNTDKLTVSVIFEISPDGDIKNHTFNKTVINSNFRFTYDGVQGMIEANRGRGKDDLSSEEYAISTLDDIAKKIRNNRFKEGSIHFNSREPRFTLNENYVPIDIYFSELKDANQLIEEFMLLANRYVGTFLYKNKIPAAFRVHDSPEEMKLTELSALVKNFGYDFSVSGDVQKVKKSLNKLLIDIKDSPEENMISTLAVRCMRKAICNEINIGHFGLGENFMPPNAYSRFTSGIRRYADIINQRQLFEFLEKNKI